MLYQGIEELLTVLKNELPQIFSEGLGCCTKTEARFEIKEKVKPVFKPKRTFFIFGGNKQRTWKIRESWNDQKSGLFRLGITDSLHKKEK